MDKDGCIILDPALTLKPKALRVRISENNVITGTSQLSVEDQTNDKAIEKTIQRARDSLLEEELYHEMSLESRQLLAYGVEYRESVIHIKAPGNSAHRKQTKLLIDCIPRDEHTASNQDHSQDWLAQNVAEGLRLLLVHEHSMRLYRRSQAQPPLSGKGKENARPPLLRTLLAIFHHLIGVDSLYLYLETVAQILRSAGLDTSLVTERETAWTKLATNLNMSKKNGMSATDQLLTIFTKPLNGRATLSLPSTNGAQPEHIIVSSQTVIGQPTFGTEYKAAIPSTLASDLGLFQQSKLPSVEEAKSYLDWVLSLHIAQRQLKSDFTTRAVSKGNDPRVTIKGKGGRKGSKSERTITVELQEGGLKVVATSNDAHESVDDHVQSYTWTGADGQVSLREKIESWLV
jgi:mediator of RNA polymerase II transcription subunit 17